VPVGGGRNLLAIAIALLGCAGSRAPIAVSERDLAAVKQILRTQTDAAFRVVGFETRDRVVEIDLVALTQGEGWYRSDRAKCRRCADAAPWTCSQPHRSTYAWSDQESIFVGGGLSGDEAVRALRFLREHPRSGSVSCIAAVSADEIYVGYGAAPHHAGSASGHLVLERSGETFSVDYESPPPSWFEGTGAPPSACDETVTVSLPEC
jgi:hypothetical protein